MFNTLKVGILMVLMTVGVVLIGRMVGGTAGMVVVFGLALTTNFVSYWFSDKIVLRMTGAQAIDPSNMRPQSPEAELYLLTQDLAQRANLPMPSLYIVNDPQPNAFATGRDPKHAAVAVNTGLLNIMSRQEVAGVVAHELAHIKYRDTLTMSVVAALAGALMVFVQIAQFSAIFGGSSRDDEGMSPMALIAMIVIGPVAATMIQMAVSRAREYEADRLAAQLTGSPDGLINALVKLERGASVIPTHSMTPQTAHMCIVNPLKGVGALESLFRTHLPMDKRIAALEALRGTIQPQSANSWA